VAARVVAELPDLAKTDQVDDTVDVHGRCDRIDDPVVH
jgi:hypothetical protein